MSKYGPTRRETWIYLIVSLAGLALMAGAVAFRGVGGIAAIEVVGMSVLFFGGTAIWAGLRLWRGRG
ncbi:hypothetical protein [uncultured Jannaschia sp.]|uniref:hypothetical protein n=1 Tax=uncultured Jannaschia sp. TaxID=293347 RepID=UPI0026203342|nr:hypothetical protein [uncultured Jannaschia sp.]